MGTMSGNDKVERFNIIFSNSNGMFELHHVPQNLYFKLTVHSYPLLMSFFKIYYETGGKKWTGLYISRGGSVKIHKKYKLFSKQEYSFDEVEKFIKNNSVSLSMTFPTWIDHYIDSIISALNIWVRQHDIRLAKCVGGVYKVYPIVGVVKRKDLRIYYKLGTI